MGMKVSCAGKGKMSNMMFLALGEYLFLVTIIILRKARG
jgi:hypothetical protein